MTVSDIEKSYAARMRDRTSPLGFSEYLRRLGKDHELVAAKRRGALLTALGKSREGYAAEDGALLDMGLSHSGYASHLKARRGKNIASALEDAENSRQRAEAEAKRGYLGYLDDFNKAQEKLRLGVVRSLADIGELNITKIYDYAADRGLSGKAAEGLYETVYATVAPVLKRDILDNIYHERISPDVAITYAASVGLNKNDILEIARYAEKYKKHTETVSEGYLEYLESLSGKNTGSFS